MAKISQLRIATRRSPLALRQAEIVKALFLQHFPALSVHLVPLATTGDQLLHQDLTLAGGKGMFIKELEQAILAKAADIAVHSLKDIPAQCAEGLEISAFLEREDPRDVWISTRYARLSDLPANARVGTASLRRQAMLRHKRQDIQVETLRGNVNTRLNKLDQGEYDAIVLAAAGLHRLGLQDRIAGYFSPEDSLPAIGQGVICIESPENNKSLRKLLIQLDHYPTRLCALAERAMNQALGGNCHAPIAGYATLTGEKLHLRGRVYTPDGSQIIHAELLGSSKDAKEIGLAVAEKLLQQGAATILAEIK